MSSNNLVIVESPAKAKTIEKILGSHYTVRSSYGHIRDLPSKGLSIDIEHGFEPQYEVSPEKTKVVAELKKMAKEADTVWLASDEDREGEAIAWHLKEALGLPAEKTKRIVFHEITPTAILNAVQTPRPIDQKLVNAQQARRVLDRLVGFELSPLLWKKVKPSLSAGRVQSVTVKLIVERERELLAFIPAPYFRVVGEFGTADGSTFKAELSDRLDTETAARSFLESLSGAAFTVSGIEKKPVKRSPAAPFTTSTLQQEAARKLGMSVSQTMSTAQKLYEAGLITYMRTDSVNLSSLALGTAKAAIHGQFGERYHKARQYTTKSKGAQEAHEAIRPTYLDRREAGTTPAERKLYDLIWKRTVASQMADAELEKTTVQIAITGRPEQFVAVGEVIVFDGFLKLYIESLDEEPGEEGALLPSLVSGAAVNPIEIVATQRFTQRPSRYSEASLVKKLEELGIGRPSTYAPTISTVIQRGYVVKENREGTKREYTQLTLKKGVLKQSQKSETVGSEKNKLFPTDIGMMVNDYLEQHFASILDVHFTANVEKEFDEIAEGAMEWQAMLAAFYGPFHRQVETAAGEESYVRSERLLGVDPKSGKNVYARVGRFGPMAQLGESQGDEKPQYASLLKGQMVATLTLDEALALFALPRTVGEFEGKTVVAAAGRFGPYVRHDGKFVSLDTKAGDDPYTVTIERAVELIQQKRTAESNRVIRAFPEADIQVLNGRFGPYLVHAGGNYKIPKGTDAAALTLEACQALIQQAPAPTPSRFSKRAAAPATKTAAKKSTVAKKAAPKSVRPAAPKKSSAKKA